MSGNKSINDLPSTTSLANEDLLVLWKQSANAAYNINGDDFKSQLLNLVDGRGYIQSITRTGQSGLVDTYTIAFTDGRDPTTFTVTNGAQGDIGLQTYVYIRYSNVNPTQDSDMGEIPDVWIGIYVGLESDPDELHYSDYTWYEWEGPEGQGVSYTTQTAVVGLTKTYTMYTASGTPVGSFSVTDGEGAVSLVNGIAPDGDGDVPITISSVADLGLTIGSATVAGVYAALTDKQAYIGPASDFTSTELPFINGSRLNDGTIEIVKGDGTDGWIEFHGRLASVGDYRMYFSSSDVPTGKWLGKCDLLWSNSSPTSSFASQNIAVDLSGYDFVTVVSRESTSSAAETSATIRNVLGVTGRIFMMANSRQFRAFEISSTGVTFNVGRSGAIGANASEDNSAAIPLYIYGVKN